jgi:hypothetical protein
MRARWRFGWCRAHAFQFLIWGWVVAIVASYLYGYAETIRLLLTAVLRAQA